MKASTTAAQAAQTAAQSAAASAQLAAQAAAQNLRPVAQSTAQNMSKSMRQGVYTARGWAAPRLESAADYTTSTAAPKVADALRTTARQVNPGSSRKSTLRSVLSMSVLAIAAAAAAGAIAILLRRQLKAVEDEPVTEGSGENDAMNIADTAEPGASVPGQAPASSPQSAGMNGQPSSSAW